MSELLRNSKFVWAVMAILIFAITLLIKLPFKKLTDKINNEVARTIANKAIVVFVFVLGFVLNFLYCRYFQMIFTVQDCIQYSASAIVIHSAFEIKFKGKVLETFNTEEAQEMAEDIVEFIEDKTQTTNTETKEKSKKKDSAVADFWKSVKKKK